MLSMTLSEEGGRLFVSVATIVAQAPCHPSQPDTLTTQLARRYGRIVVEDLDIAAMARGMGRRAFRRSVYRAGLGQVRPTLAYKTSWAGGICWWPTAGSPPPSSIMAAAAIWPGSFSASGFGSALPAGRRRAG